MPTYLFACSSCKKQFEEFRPMAESSAPAYHCDTQAVRVFTAPQIINVFQPYKAIGGDRRWITTRQEHKDFLKRFNYEEVGNDSSMAPPRISDEEFAHDKQKALDECADTQKTQQKLFHDLAITPQGE